MKILKIDEMNNCGHFKRFRWPNNLENFKRINVIYGPNGSGKSSFSRAFEVIGQEGFSGIQEMTFSYEDELGNQKQTTLGSEQELSDRIFVYSDRYVEKGHSFRTDPSLVSVLTVGERTVEDERKLNKVQNDLETARNERSSAIAKEKRTEKNIKDLYSSVSDSVVSAVSAAGGRWRNKSAFNVQKVKQAFEDDSSKWIKLSEEEKGEKIALVNSAKMDAIDVPAVDLNLINFSVEELKRLLSATPVSQMLDTLRQHPEASTWVQEGLKFHKEAEVCIFCSNSLSEKRKEEISQHFSDEVEKLQLSLETMLAEMTSAKDMYSDLLTKLPDVRFFSNNLKDSFRSARESVEQQFQTFQESVDTNIAIVNRKLTNVLVSVDDSPLALPDINFSNVFSVIEEHNRVVDNRDRLIGEAARAVEEHYLQINHQNLQGLKNELREYTKVLLHLDTEIDRLEKEQAALLNREGDPLPAAETMTSRVAEILGRSELNFNVTPDGERYQVTRNGQPAKELSTGERSVIMLVYFLERVARYDKPQKPIVVIDDPVSSMDSNSFMGISTYIWSKMTNQQLVDQVFLLTHNFELFRQWDIQLEGAGNSVKSQLYEIRSEYQRSEGGSSERQPSIQSWPPSKAARKKVRSSYHQMFMSIAEAKRKLEHEDNLDNRLDAQLLFPNVIRRLLETFLAFRDPNAVGSFFDSMRNATAQLRESSYRGDADALILRLIRYSHAYSHSETPESDAMIAPDEVHTAIAAVFTFIEALDPLHFKGMCKVLNLKATDLTKGVNSRLTKNSNH